jgi:transcriptional regulator with XRE-family HTH domain
MLEGKDEVRALDSSSASSAVERKDACHARRATFSAAIADAFATIDMPRANAAQSLGVSEAAVSYWVAGQRVPDPETVFALERLLGCAPGELSRHLGYVPAETDRSPADVVAAVHGCGLSLESKERVIDLYRLLCRHEVEKAELAAELETATLRLGVKSRGQPSKGGVPGRPAKSP